MAKAANAEKQQTAKRSTVIEEVRKMEQSRTGAASNHSRNIILY
jgi:hypothetical protein